ncbi:MAG: hypothetical protein LBP39_03560 [Rickettsiales bacterium]|jgi:hypothetical protein|nr:hypothetical protein [Rickettsiales bacterium]
MTERKPEEENKPDPEEESKSEEENKSKSGLMDFGSINCKEFETIDQKLIDLYYTLNDGRSNPEFLDEDLVKLGTKEEEMKALSLKAKEEFEFDMEELVDDGKTVKVDLTGIVNDAKK